MVDWSQSNQVVILIIFIWPIIVYNDTLFIIVWVISKVKFENGVTFQGIPTHGWRWCYICEVWSLKFENALTNIFSLYVWILFYQPFYPYQWPSCPLKISRANLEKSLTQYYLLIYILLPYLSLVSHLLQNWKKNSPIKPSQ